MTAPEVASRGRVADFLLLTQFHCAGLWGNYLQNGGKIFRDTEVRWYPTLSFAGANDEGGATRHYHLCLRWVIPAVRAGRVRRILVGA